jgi:hypothetical protein
VTCSECETRRRCVEESTELLRDKMLKYSHHSADYQARLLVSYQHQLKVALDNLAFHERECTERQP